MSERHPNPAASRDDDRRPPLAPLIIVIAFGAAVAGALIGRGLMPTPTTQGMTSSGRPIVQIVRTPNLPSLAQTIDGVCPAVARIVTANGAPGAGVPAFAVSADGWLVSEAALPANTQLQAIFGDGRRAAITETRRDPVSGIVIAHADSTGLPVLPFADQLFAKVGDFGFTLQSPNGSGCSAQESMIGSDFLVDALAQGIYLRFQPQPTAPPAGTPFLAADGSVLGITSDAAANAVLPAPIAALIVNELIRNDVSPIASFGFRAIDFTTDLAARIGGSRRGAGVAIVQPKSSAAAAGLQAGDIILAVNGSPVSSTSELSRALDAVDTSATLQVVRGDRQLSMTVARSS